MPIKSSINFDSKATLIYSNPITQLVWDCKLIDEDDPRKEISYGT